MRQLPHRKVNQMSNHHTDNTDREEFARAVIEAFIVIPLTEWYYDGRRFFAYSKKGSAMLYRYINGYNATKSAHMTSFELYIDSDCIFDMRQYRDSWRSIEEPFTGAFKAMNEFHQKVQRHIWDRDKQTREEEAEHAREDERKRRLDILDRL
jgi:hypothetical protein